MKKTKRGNMGNNKSFSVFNIITVCVIVLLFAGLFLLEEYKKSGYVYEGEYVYAKDDVRQVINVEFEPESEVLLINLTEIIRAPYEYKGETYYYDGVVTHSNLELPLADMDAALKYREENVNMWTYEMLVEFDKKGLTMIRETDPALSFIGDSELYFYKNGWLYSMTAEIAQLVIIAVIMVHIVVCVILNVSKYKKYISQVDESFYDKFTIGEMIYINDSFKGMEDYFEKNILDSPVEFSVYKSKIREKETERPEYKVSMVSEPYFTPGKNTTVKQIEIFDSEGNKSEYVVLHRKGRYILKQGGENMTIAVYKLKKVLSVILILGLVGITFGGCRQEINDKYNVTGRIVSIENDVLRLNMAFPEIYSPQEDIGDKNLQYIFDKDDYFTAGLVYEDVYYCEQELMYADFKLSDDWHKYFNEEEILKKASCYLYELVIENGRVESCRKTDYYCLSTDSVPLGMIGEFYCSMDTFITDYTSGDDVEIMPEEFVRWDFYADGIVFDKGILQSGLRKRTCYFKINNISKLRIYRLKDDADNFEQYWIDTPKEDLIIKIKEKHYDVFSYPGGVFLDEEGNLCYYNSDITESVYTVTDLGYEIKDQTITIINKGGK